MSYQTEPEPCFSCPPTAQVTRRLTPIANIGVLLTLAAGAFGLFIHTPSCTDKVFSAPKLQVSAVESELPSFSGSGQGCPSSAYENIEKCFACQDVCTPESLGFSELPTPDSLFTSSPFATGTDCFCIPPNIPPTFFAPTEEYSFLGEWADTGAWFQYQPGESPYLQNAQQEALVKLWWISSAQDDGESGPRSTLTQTPVQILLRVQEWPGGPGVPYAEINVLEEGSPVCETEILGPTPFSPIAHVQSWTVSLPSNIGLVYLSTKVPVLGNECWTADWDLYLKTVPAP